MLTAAGLPAAYAHHPLGDTALAPYRRAIAHTLAALDPYPAIVVDRVLVIVDASGVGTTRGRCCRRGIAQALRCGTGLVRRSSR